jgi:hypothetical protein
VLQSLTIMQPAPATTITLPQIKRLATEAYIPTREIELLYSGLETTPQECARGLCALASIVGRLCPRDQITFSEASNILRSVNRLLETCPSEAFLAWFTTRDDSDFAIGRDYINFSRKFGASFPMGVSPVMDSFSAAVKTRLGDPQFDILKDTLERREPIHLTLELVKIVPPRSRLSFN